MNSAKWENILNYRGISGQGTPSAPMKTSSPSIESDVRYVRMMFLSTNQQNPQY